MLLMRVYMCHREEDLDIPVFSRSLVVPNFRVVRSNRRLTLFLLTCVCKGRREDRCIILMMQQNVIFGAYCNGSRVSFSLPCVPRILESLIFSSIWIRTLRCKAENPLDKMCLFNGVQGYERTSKKSTSMSDRMMQINGELLSIQESI